MALIAKHWENRAIARPRCSGGVSSITASVAVGRKAAWAKAIGSRAASTSAVPDSNRDETAINPQPKLNPARLKPRPKATLRSASHLRSVHQQGELKGDEGTAVALAEGGA